MSQIALTGDPPEQIRSALLKLGLEIDEGADITVHWCPDEQSLDTIRTLADQDEAVIAIVGDDALLDAAVQAGAIDAWSGVPDPLSLHHQIDTTTRLQHLWRRKMRRRERDARRTLNDLQTTQDLLGRLINATPNPVMAVDMRGRVLVFNRAAEGALGYDSDWAMKHMHVTDIYASPDDARRILSQIRESPERMVQGLEIRLRSRSGEQFPVLLSAAEVSAADGMPLATVGVFEDLRQEQALRNRLEQTTEQLIETEKRAAAMEVAGAAAHELNQPLTAVMGCLELLELKTDLDTDTQARIQRAYIQLERMAEIVRSLANSKRTNTIRYVGHTRILDLHTDTENTQ
jgi:PAS domain S-box-containing protein